MFDDDVLAREILLLVSSVFFPLVLNFSLILDDIPKKRYIRLCDQLHEDDDGDEEQATISPTDAYTHSHTLTHTHTDGIHKERIIIFRTIAAGNNHLLYTIFLAR